MSTPKRQSSTSGISSDNEIYDELPAENDYDIPVSCQNRLTSSSITAKNFETSSIEHSEGDYDVPRANPVWLTDDEYDIPRRHENFDVSYRTFF